MSKTTYLVTGATRGIGAEVVKQLLQRPNNLVIAGVRDVNNAAAKELKSGNQNLVVVQLDSSSESDPQRAVKTLAQQGITHIDVLIANAGIATDFVTVQNAKPADVRTTYDVNLIGPLVLFQAFLPLLQKSQVTPKFIAVSTAIASIGYQPHLPYKAFSYGASKVALNYLTVRTALEHPEIVSVAIHPGLVKTDLAEGAAKSLGTSLDTLKAITPTQSATALIALADAAALDTHSGKFFNAPEGTDAELPW